MSSPENWAELTRQELEWFAANGDHDQRANANRELDALRTYKTGDLFSGQDMPFSLSLKRGKA